MANVLSTDKRSRLVAALVEGCSIRSTARMVGVCRNTVIKLLLHLADACAKYQSEHLRDLPCKRVQVDEIWSFVYATANSVRKAKKGQFGYGDVWTWTAIDAGSELAVSWLVGSRDGGVAMEFIGDIPNRLAARVQLTWDGLKTYLEPVEDVFGSEIDHAQLQKIYGTDPQTEHRYSPAQCIGAQGETISGNRDPEHVATSCVERQNLAMRMSMRRFTRLTNGLSKKIENHTAAVELHFFYYNWCRPHRSLRTKKDNRITPAMAAGIAERPWTIEELIGLLPPPVAEKRGPHWPRTSN